MLKCEVCGSDRLSKKYVNDVFYIKGKPILIEHIPAIVCERCGEVIFDIDVAEGIRKMIYKKEKPVRSINMDVYAYAYTY